MQQSPPQRDSDGFRAVVGIELAENIIDVEFDCPLGNSKGYGNLVVALSHSQELQDFEFSLCQGRALEVIYQLSSESAGKISATIIDRAHTGYEVLSWHVFQEIRFGSSPQCTTNVLIAIICGEHDKARRSLFRQYRSNSAHPSSSGMRKSISAISGRCARNNSTASRP